MYTETYLWPSAGTGTDEAQDTTANMLRSAPNPSMASANPIAAWDPQDDGSVSISHRQPVTYLTWHAKGDYFASVAPTGKYLYLV